MAFRGYLGELAATQREGAGSHLGGIESTLRVLLGKVQWSAHCPLLLNVGSLDHLVEPLRSPRREIDVFDLSDGPLAHRVEQGPFKPKVPRSRLGRSTCYCYWSCLPPPTLGLYVSLAFFRRDPKSRTSPRFIETQSRASM